MFNYKPTKTETGTSEPKKPVPGVGQKIEYCTWCKDETIFDINGVTRIGDTREVLLICTVCGRRIKETSYVGSPAINHLNPDSNVDIFQITRKL